MVWFVIGSCCALWKSKSPEAAEREARCANAPGGFKSLSFQDRLYLTKRSVAAKWQEGFESVPETWLIVGGVMAAVPFLSTAVDHTVGWLFGKLGSTSAIAGCFFIGTDLGGNALAFKLANGSLGDWYLGTMVGYTVGTTISYSIPLGTAKCPEADRRYMALALGPGLLSVPFASAVFAILMWISKPNVSSTVTTSGIVDVKLEPELGTWMQQLAVPLGLALIMAILTRFFEKGVVRCFSGFATGLNVAITVVFTLSAVQNICSFFTISLIGWGFDPIMATESQVEAGLEVAGIIALMLMGCYPALAVLELWCLGDEPDETASGVQESKKVLGLSTAGIKGMFGTLSNSLAMFEVWKSDKSTTPADKVQLGN
jgi:ethanolamine transporter